MPTKTKIDAKRSLKTDYQKKVDDNIIKAAHKNHMAKNGGSYADSKMQKNLNYILSRLTKANGLNQRVYHISILKTNKVNAYSLGSYSRHAYIYLTKSMVDFAQNNDQRASVIAHELSHIILDHHLLRQGVSNSQFNQNQELEADKYSIKLLKKAGFRAKASVSLLKKFNAYLSNFIIEDQEDYPNNDKRIKALKASLNML